MEHITTDPIVIKPTEFKPLQGTRVKQYYSRISQYNGVTELGYTPLPGVRLDGYYVIGEGHHTCAALLLLNRPIILCLLETDRDVKECNIGYFRHFQNRDGLVMELREHMIHALRSGVTRFYDLDIKLGRGKLGSLLDEDILERLLKLKVPNRNMSQQQTGNIGNDLENIRLTG